MWVQELDFSNNSLTGVPLDSLAAMPRLRLFLPRTTPSITSRRRRSSFARAAPFGLQCTGLPQESCSAFGGPYRVALDETAECILCDNIVLSVLALLIFIFAQVGVVILYASIVVANPRALENNIASISILFTLYDTTKILLQLRLIWPPEIERILAILVISPTLFKSARAECLFAFAEDYTFYYYNIAKLVLPMSQIFLVWGLRCLIGPWARKRSKQWLELASALEYWQVEELLEPLGAAGKSIDQLLKQQTIQNLVRTLDYVAHHQHTSFKQLTVAHIEALLKIGLDDATKIARKMTKKLSGRGLLKSAGKGGSNKRLGLRGRRDTFAVDHAGSSGDASKERPGRIVAMRQTLVAADELERLKRSLEEMRMSEHDRLVAADSLEDAHREITRKASPSSGPPTFLPATTFEGPKQGYVFKAAEKGLGYYAEPGSPASNPYGWARSPVAADEGGGAPAAATPTEPAPATGISSASAAVQIRRANHLLLQRRHQLQRRLRRP